MQTCSHQMPASPVIYVAKSDHLILRAATPVQPTSVCLSQPLHHAFRPASTQLQRPLRSRPLVKAPQATPAPTVVTAAADNASKAATANAPRVKAAFAEAGLSQDAIAYILTQYPYYLRWDVEQKLLPAMQRNQQVFGARFPSAMGKNPKMLLRSSGILAKAQIARKAAKVKAASANAARVKATFTEAGLSQDAVDHVVTQYPSYLGWDVEQKLLPAIQRWQQQLGDGFISGFERIPYLLLKEPEEEQLKDQYLVSMGIESPERLRKKSPYAFQVSIGLLQDRLAVLQACGFTHAQVTSVVEKDPMILSRSSEYVEEMLRVIGDIFDCAGDMTTIVEVMLRCKCVRLSSMSVATLHHNFLYLCTQIVVDDKSRKRAWRDGVFSVAPAELDIRLNSIAAQLDSTLNEAKAVVRGMPVIANLQPETVRLHITQLLGLGFSHGQVKSMCLRQPVLLTYSYSSDVHVAKWGFLTCVLQLSHDAIAACPHLLMSSLPNRLGPRWAYLQQLRSHDVIAFTAAPQVLGKLVALTDSDFRVKYTTPECRVYNEHFQKQWQQRWDFLLVDQQLSIQDIGDNPDLLHISLTDM